MCGWRSAGTGVVAGWDGWGGLIAIGGVVLLLAGFFVASGGRVTAELEPADVLVAPPGLRLRPSATLESQTEAQLRADPELRDALQGVAVREIEKAGAGVLGALTIMAIDPVRAGQPGQEDGYIRGLQGRAGVEPSPLTLEGESIFEFVVPPTETVRRLYILAWQHENLFISVTTSDQETAYAVASSVITGSIAAG